MNVFPIHLFWSVVYLFLHATHSWPAVGPSNTGVLYGASIGGVLVFLLLTASILAFLGIAMRKYYTAKHHRKSQEDIADYASVPIAPWPTVGVDLRPDLPQRRKEIHVEKNVAYDKYQLEQQPANEAEKDGTRTSGLRCGTQVQGNEITSNVDTSETDCNRTSVIGFDDDGYPIMQRTGDILYMDVLPPQTDPKDTATASEFQVTKEHSSKPKHNQDMECNDDDGYPSLCP